MTDDFFGEDSKDWKWKTFKTTEGFPVSSVLLEWVIGQEKAIEETRLSIDEWIAKLKYLKKKRWWKVFENPLGNKPQPKEWLPAGPFILMLGDAGTGKSLIGRALSTYMTDLYKQHKIQLYDVVAWKNDVIPSEPKISIHKTPDGKKLVIREKLKERKKGRWGKIGLKLAQFFLLGLGVVLLGVSFYLIGPWVQDYTLWGEPLPYDFVRRITSLTGLLVAGGSLTFSGIFIGYIGRWFGGNSSGKQGIGGAEATNAPKLLVDNSDGRCKFIDATGHGSAQLFGSIAWDPYQSGGLGTPEHQRVTAGDVHRANLGILYIDELKNLTGPEATTLLTVLEDGQIPVALRSLFHGGDTAAMAVSTEPIPSMTFFIGAGNLDSLERVHPALLDRIQGYGKTVYMNNDMPNNVKNRRKYIQFICQEVKRFNLLPFSREACIEVISESRKKSGFNNKLTCKFRPMISILKTASIIASNEGTNNVETKHVKEAVEKHCKAIGLQIMERHAEKITLYKTINVNSKPKIGQIAIMSVWHDEDESDVGGITILKTSSIKYNKTKSGGSGSFIVTGVNTQEGSWVQNSIKKVYHVVSQFLKNSIPAKVKICLDFSQSINVDGPSAGVAMTLAVISVLTNTPIKQDVAVTGEINIGVDNEFIVTPIGAVHEKILAAQQHGYKKVLIPKRNYEINIVPEDYTVEVVPCETLQDYIKHALVDKK